MCRCCLVPSVVLLQTLTMCLGVNIFLLPYTHVFNSRSMNMEKISRLLVDHGHNVTMMVADHYKSRLNISGVSLIRYRTPKLKSNAGGKLDLDTVMASLENIRDATPIMQEMTAMENNFCDVLFGDKDMLHELKASNFSLFFFDCIHVVSGTVLNDFLNIPSIAYSNLGFWNAWPVFLQPVFKSFMPAISGGHSDHMTFWERLDNWDLDIAVDDWLHERFEYAEKLVLRYFPNQNWPSVKHGFERVSIMIAANADFAFDYPQPVMPHVKPISGLLWTPPKALPKFYQDLMNSARNGVVLMSFGTLVADFAEETGEKIARVLASLPQTVIWRYTGPTPKSLGRNTHLVDWFPQNDLLVHPATKLFITHCGVSSTWETLYHAVPVVAMPLFWDQHHNARKLTDRCKIGISLKFLNFTEEDFAKAIYTVINDKSYRENAAKVSKLVKDQPLPAQEELLYWINYVMRHNGSLHLHSQAAYNLNWFEYYLIDVILYKFIVRCSYYMLYLSFAVITWKVVKMCFFSQSWIEKSKST